MPKLLGLVLLSLFFLALFVFVLLVFVLFCSFGFGVFVSFGFGFWIRVLECFWSIFGWEAKSRSSVEVGTYAACPLSCIFIMETKEVNSVYRNRDLVLPVA